MQLLVQVAIPLHIGKQVQVVLTTLIPVIADVGLSAMKASHKGVQPVVHLHLAAVNRLEFLAVNLLCLDLQLGCRGVGLNHNLFRSLGEQSLVISHQLGIVDHEAITCIVHPTPLLLRLIKPAVVDLKPQPRTRRSGGLSSRHLLVVKHKRHEQVSTCRVGLLRHSTLRHNKNQCQKEHGRYYISKDISHSYSRINNFIHHHHRGAQG